MNSPRIFLDSHTHTLWVPLPLGKTTSFSLNSQNFDNPVLMFKCVSLKRIWASFKLNSSNFSIIFSIFPPATVTFSNQFWGTSSTVGEKVRKGAYAHIGKKGGGSFK